MYVFQVSPDGADQFVVRANMRDVLAWERSSASRAAQQLSENFHLGDAYWIAHHAAKRQGLFDGSRKEFEETCDVAMGTVVMDDEAEVSTDRDDADPTQSGR